MSLKERFLDKVSPEPNTGCWLWVASAIPAGHGMIRDGKMKYAHRVSWELYHGPIPDGLCVCHKCDTPACVNPEHLCLGTQYDNMQDMVQRGRQNKPKGSVHYAAKLNEPKVRAIKALLSCGWPQKKLADAYGVDKSKISQIKRGLAWVHV